MITGDFRYSFAVHGSHGHGVGGIDHSELRPKPEERELAKHGPVRILVENGKKLKTPKVIHP